MYRGEIWWSNLPGSVGSEPGYRRPVLVIQEDVFTQSRINTVIVLVITSNTQLAQGASHFCSPHPKSLSQGGRGTLNLVLPFSRFGRRGWGMRATLQNWDALVSTSPRQCAVAL
jgi:hypothetical protein